MEVKSLVASFIAEVSSIAPQQLRNFVAMSSFTRSLGCVFPHAWGNLLGVESHHRCSINEIAVGISCDIIMGYMMVTLS